MPGRQPSLHTRLECQVWAERDRMEGQGEGQEGEAGEGQEGGAGEGQEGGAGEGQEGGGGEGQGRGMGGVV